MRLGGVMGGGAQALEREVRACWWGCNLVIASKQHKWNRALNMKAGTVMNLILKQKDREVAERQLLVQDAFRQRHSGQRA